MYNSSTVIWVLVAAFLVYFMQAGFALCEAGLTRAKNTGNILMKNMMDFCIGTPCFWLVGFGIMFAGSGPLIGGFAPFMSGDYSAILPEGVPLWVYAVFQTVFCATAATIVSGSMAERTKFSAYCCYSAAISLIVYPLLPGYQASGSTFFFCDSVLLLPGVLLIIMAELLKEAVAMQKELNEVL